MKPDRKLYLLTIVFVFLNIVACSPVRDDLQGTSKVSYSEDRDKAVKIKFPVKLSSFQSLEFDKHPDILKTYIKSFGKDWFNLVASHFYMEGPYLKLDVTSSQSGVDTPVVNIDYSTNTQKTVMTARENLYATILSPDGDELTEYDCDVEVSKTRIRNLYDFEGDHVMDVLKNHKTAGDRARYNCWVELINQMAEDVEQINKWHQQYILKKK